MRYFLRPTISSNGLERRISGNRTRRHLDPGGGFTHKHNQRGPNGQLPCLLDQQRPPLTLRDHGQSASALSALKKSLVANLSAKRQLSVAKLSAKRNVSLAKRDFLVANGRMAADFSSPEVGLKKAEGSGRGICFAKEGGHERSVAKTCLLLQATKV